jgi:hypothetical protein
LLRCAGRRELKAVDHRLVRHKREMIPSEKTSVKTM